MDSEKIEYYRPENNPRNLHSAMQYNPVGQPEIRVAARVENFEQSESLTVNLGDGANDAFGRLRISSPFTLFDSFHRYADNGKIGQYNVGVSGSTFNSNAGCVTMTVGGNTGDLIYRESLRTFAYQPGKSLLVLQTFCMAPATTGLRQRQGYFDVDNGFFIELDGTTLSFVRRSKASGVVREDRVSQLEWNVDGMGIGPLNPSGITLDISRVQIFFTDIEWLGVGTVRQGFVINGQFHTCHMWHHANSIGTVASPSTLPYMTTAILPVRAELQNTGNTLVSSNYNLICTSVISEGGYELRGRPRSIASPLGSPYDTGAVANAIKPLITIRLKSNRLGAIVLPRELGIMPTDNLTGKWYIIQGGTTSGGSGTWVSAGDDSSVEYKMDATSITGGTVTESGFLQAQAFAGTRASLESGTFFKYQLERNTFVPTAYEFTLALAITGTNKSVYAAISWEEVT